MTSRFVLPVLVCGLAAGMIWSITHGKALQEGPSKAASAPPSSLDSAEVRFSGEVLRGQIYEHDVGHNMIFRLTPTVSVEGGGWVIGMLPSVEPADESLEFVQVATPPYHGYNDRYLAAAAGYSSREAVTITTRKFYFVRSVADEHIASEVVNAALYPSTIAENEKSRIETESAQLDLGSGELHIIRWRITSGKGGEPDTIAWLKFEVVVNFSSGVTLQSVLAPRPRSHR